jgi:predicted metal-dependent phosphoesterase TrpH
LSRVDLHIHSSVSDGRLSPEEVVREASRRGLTVIALTDHDNVGGIAPALAAARAFPSLRVIPGVELSTDLPQGEVHILGYFINYESDELAGRLGRMRNSRLERAQLMIGKLAALGMNVSWERVLELAGGGSVGRPHIAQAMLEKGYVGSVREAFNRYLGRGCPAYVERPKLTPVAAVELVRRVGGLPVLAHPFTVNDPEALLPGLLTAGLAGIEAYYKDYGPEEVGRLLGLVRRHGLLATGGSDFHGLDAEGETAMGGVDVPDGVAEALIALATSRKAGVALF